jgi:hypothetical protein
VAFIKVSTHRVAGELPACSSARFNPLTTKLAPSQSSAASCSMIALSDREGVVVVVVAGEDFLHKPLMGFGSKARGLTAYAGGFASLGEGVRAAAVPIGARMLAAAAISPSLFSEQGPVGIPSVVLAGAWRRPKSCEQASPVKHTLRQNWDGGPLMGRLPTQPQNRRRGNKAQSDFTSERSQFGSLREAILP